MSHSFQTILSPIDFDENSLAALRIAGEFARIANARLFVLHVLKPATSTSARVQLDNSVAQEKIATDRLAAICRERFGDLQCLPLARTGEPAICIIRAAQEVKANLIVIATHASHRTPRPFPGSVTERVIRESICPVVTVRPSPNGDPDAVATHMTVCPTTVSIDTTVAHLRQRIIEERVRWLPVVDGSEVIGIVTDRDITFADASAETTVASLMSREVLTVSPRTSIQEAARELYESEVEALPVVEEGKLVGVITRSDILKVFAGIEAETHSGPRRVLVQRGKRPPR